MYSIRSMKQICSFFTVTLILFSILACEFRAEEKQTKPAEEIKVSQTMDAELTRPPQVPEIGRAHV